MWSGESQVRSPLENGYRKFGGGRLDNRDFKNSPCPLFFTDCSFMKVIHITGSVPTTKRIGTLIYLPYEN